MPQRALAHRRRIAWLVAWAMWLAACLPLLSHAALAGRPAVATEVCAASGVRFVVTEAVEASGPAPAQQVPWKRAMASCPGCACHIGAMLPPAAPPALLAVAPPPARWMPAAILTVPTCGLEWAPSWARAPPPLA